MKAAQAQQQEPEDSVKRILNKYSDLLADEFHGCLIDEGWADLLDHLLEEWRDVNAPPIAKIKTKLGTMRITATDQSHPEARRLRQKAMQQSEQTCEVCGSPGEPVADRGIRTCLCVDHAFESRVQEGR